jgi:peptidoglycan/xylan/chitin deacetylase (PgdA/CDA1 family)
MLICVVYHYVRPRFDEPYHGIHGITPEQLAAQLALLGGVGEFVSAEQIRDAVRGHTALPPAAMLVTFDDALREQFERALPVLDRLGIPALFFVNTAPIADRIVLTVHKIHLLRARVAPKEFMALMATHAQRCGVPVPSAELDEGLAIYRYDTPEAARLKYLLNFRLRPSERDELIGACFADVFDGAEPAKSEQLYMSRQQVRALAARGYVGSHGHAHVPLGLLSRDAIRSDVATSLDLLTQWRGTRPYSLGYPYGAEAACSGEAGAIAADLGIEFAFTAERAGNQDLAAPLFLARFDCNDLPGGKGPLFEAANLFDEVPEATWRR